MIQKLRRKLVLIVMAVVSVILLTIFFVMLLTTQRNNERMSVSFLRQALGTRPIPEGGTPPFDDGRPGPYMRLPVLIVEMSGDGTVSVISNQLHFIEEKDIVPLAGLVSGKEEDVGVLSDYGLRYLRSGARVAFADITMEQEILRTQIVNSLLIGGAAMLAFFLLSLALARWAVHPVETAWERQKQFVANASHELKTPLTVILSNADMLRSELHGDKNTRRMEHIHAEALRMKQLVEDMLLLARSDSQEGGEIHSTVDFSDLITSTALMYEPIFYDEGKVLSYEIEDGLSVSGAPLQLQQVAHILLDNARKYSAPQGAVHVSLSKADHKSLLLKVTNEGPPIPREELEQIFLRFYRRDEARSGHGSFGLGLSIAQGIILGHRGKIWADSDGSSVNRFYVSLPLIARL